MHCWAPQDFPNAMNSPTAWDPTKSYDADRGDNIPISQVKKQISTTFNNLIKARKLVNVEKSLYMNRCSLR